MAMKVIFDERSPYWSKDNDANKSWLALVVHSAVSKYAIRSKSYKQPFFINEFLDILGLPRKKIGQTYGWSGATENPERLVNDISVKELDGGRLEFTINCDGDVSGELED